jgi:hypothetical protein
MRVVFPLFAGVAIAAATFVIARSFGVFFVFLPFVFVPFVWRRRRRVP